MAKAAKSPKKAVNAATKTTSKIKPRARVAKAAAQPVPVMVAPAIAAPVAPVAAATPVEKAAAPKRAKAKRSGSARRAKKSR
jgi:hypothetical protein